MQPLPALALGFALVAAPACTTSLTASFDPGSATAELVVPPQEQGGGVEWNELDPREFQARLMEVATPGEEHRELAKGAGTWDVTGKMWMGPDAEPMPMEASNHVRTMLDDRYLFEEFRGSFLGMPFEGRQILGYDKLAGRWVSVWMDTMSTWPSIAYGQRNDEGDLEFHGTARDPMTPDGRPTRMVIHEEGPDRFTARMYDALPDGGEFLVMELQYRRQGTGEEDGSQDG